MTEQRRARALRALECEAEVCNPARAEVIRQQIAALAAAIEAARRRLLEAEAA